MENSGIRPIKDLLNRGVEDGLFTHAAASWSVKGVPGRAYSDDMAATSRFDLASLTKPLVTAYSVAAWAEEGMIDLDQPLGAEWGETAGLRIPENWAASTPRQLLSHTTGAPPYLAPFNQPVECRSHPLRLLQAILDQPWISLEGSHRYSCLNFIVLKHWSDEQRNGGLAHWWQSHVGAGALGGTGTDFAVPTSAGCRPGVTHDPLSRHLGGFGGNAGLFASLDELVPFVRRLQALPAEWGHGYWDEVGTSQRTAGWDLAVHPDAAAAAFFAGGIGHYGFTGTSLWFSPDRRDYSLLLTNRVFPTSWWRSLEQFRKTYHLRLHALSG